jgi:Xaa-Pro aminopeptidase
MRSLVASLAGLLATVPGAAQQPGAAPTGEDSVVAALPGMGRPVDTDATAARRRAVLRAVGRGVVLVPAARRRDLEGEVVQDNDFRQSNTFFYLTQLETPDAWLLLVAGPDSLETVLFLPARDPARERWTGVRLGPDTTAARLSGIPRVEPVDSLDEVLADAWRRAGGPLYAPLDPSTEREPRVQALVFGGRFPRDVRNLRPITDSLRMTKDADELRRLRRAIAITVRGHLAALDVVRPGLREYQLEAAIEEAFRWHGADRVGFPSIVGSGPNGTTFHYDVNRRAMRDGELVVIDIGAEWGQYTADITRTLPVGGRFTPRQRALYQLVLGAQRAAFDSTRPGRTLRQLREIAVRYLRAHSGDLCGDKTCEAYFGHGLSHHLGMEVHDVAVPGREALAPGMVITIEPGIYLPAEQLGVRVEDDVLVTATGAEWLSADAPRAVEEIERLMRRRAAGR